MRQSMPQYPSVHRSGTCRLVHTNDWPTCRLHIQTQNPTHAICEHHSRRLHVCVCVCVSLCLCRRTSIQEDDLRNATANHERNGVVTAVVRDLEKGKKRKKKDKRVSKPATLSHDCSRCG
jgi:hypothetical protein